jgi:hypothetical protein
LGLVNGRESGAALLTLAQAQSICAKLASGGDDTAIIALNRTGARVDIQQETSVDERYAVFVRLE